MYTVAVVGGGFSGTITAVRLLRRGLSGGLRVIVINRSGAIARGVAYGTHSSCHVLNVPAGRMSAFDEEPDSFIRFVRGRAPDLDVDSSTFVPRHLYGAYLESLLDEAALSADGAQLDRLTAEVVRVAVRSDERQVRLTLHDGTTVVADRVVLAVGNYPPQVPSIADHAFCASSRRYVADPWASRALTAVDPHQPVLLLGTGLTMVDIVLELRARGHDAVCLAMSRHGLLPRPHRGPSQVPTPTEPPAFHAEPASTRGYLRTVRHDIRERTAHGGDWRDVLASLRPVTPMLWQALSIAERARFLRHLRPFWEVHRHRLAPQLHEQFSRLLDTAQVRILAGRLLDLRALDAGDDERVLVRYRLRGSSDAMEMTVSSVINCTGPAGDTRRLEDPLFNSLRAGGLIMPDVLGLGLETAPTGAVIDANGRASTTVYYVGPFLRAREWEATAVPELRRFAAELADYLIDTVGAPNAAVSLARSTA